MQKSTSSSSRADAFAQRFFFTSSCSPSQKGRKKNRAPLEKKEKMAAALVAKREAEGIRFGLRIFRRVDAPKAAAVAAAAAYCGRARNAAMNRRRREQREREREDVISVARPL